MIKTKEQEKFSDYYSIQESIVEKFLRSNTFLPFGLESLKYPVIFTEKVPMGAPAATDYQYIYINPIDELFKDKKINFRHFLSFLNLHEICHNIFNHKIRGDGRDQILWNYSTDFFINLFLRNIEKENKQWDDQANLIVLNIDTYQDQILFDESFSNMIEEEIYELLQKNSHYTKKESEVSYKDFLDDVGIPSDNIPEDIKVKVIETNLKYGKTNCKQTIIEFPTLKSQEDPKQKEARELDNKLAKTMFENRILGRGFESKEFEKFIKRIFIVKVNWEVILRDSILIDLQKSSDISYGHPRLTWLTQPSLPYMANYTEEEKYGTLFLLIDESGSMSDDDIDKAINIVQQADSYYKNIYVLKHDTLVLWSKLYEEKLTEKDIDELHFRKHYGETSHRDAFNKVLEFSKDQNLDISLILSLTDMCSDLEESQKILPIKIPRIYLRTIEVFENKCENIVGKVINIK